MLGRSRAKVRFESGARIEHPQRLIDMARYGSERGELPAASYRLVSRPPKDGASEARTHFLYVSQVVLLSEPPVKKERRSQQDDYSGRKAFWANSL